MDTSAEPPQRPQTTAWRLNQRAIWLFALGLLAGAAIALHSIQESLGNYLTAPIITAYEILKGSLGFAALLGLLTAGSYWQNLRQSRRSASLLAAREEAEALLDQLVGENHDGVWARNEQGEALYANNTLKFMLGLEGPLQGNLFDHWRQCIHPQDVALFEQGEKTLASQGHREIHYRLQVPGQPLCWVEDRASVIRNEASAARTMGFLVDITERKRHEQQVSALSRYLGILSQTNQAIIRCQHANELYKELVEVLTRYGGFSASWIVTTQRNNTGETRLAASAGVHSELQKALALHHSVGQTETEQACWQEMHMAREFQPQVRSMTTQATFPLLLAHFPRQSCLLSFPLREEGDVVATLTLVGKPDDDIDDEAMAMLYGLSVDVSFALNIYAREALRRQAEKELRLAAKVFESNREGVIITDARQRILSVNRAFTEVTGYLAEEVIGLTPAILSSGQQEAAFYSRMWDNLQEKGYWQGEIWNRRRNGEIYPELLSISAVTDEKKQPTHYIGVFSDITDSKQDQQRLEFLAHHDALTGLPNRVLLRDRVEVAAINAKRNHRNAALVFLDLDNFKAVNDSLGHPIGDKLLVSLVERISQCLRESDTLSRLGGDEFVAVLSEIREAEDAAIVARKILAAVETPIVVEGHSLNMTFSIGIAIFPEDGDDFDSLLRNADTAMYHAKKAGKRTYRFFEDDMNAGAMEKLQLQSSLFHAAERGELHLVYQPQVDIASNRIIGAEALLRWTSPEHGVVSPGRFIPIAEESGFILSIGDWVLEEACRQIRQWLDASLPPIVVAVNISGLQFKQGKLVDRVTGLLDTYAIPPACLELEITESTMVQNDDTVLNAVTELKKLGVLLSIDDFGTGYSNLSYLRQFNADKLKIDQSFVRVMGDGNDESALVQTIIQMARNLKLTTIAEGVETEMQLNQLTAMGCEEIQGYLFSKPLAPAAFADRLIQNTRQLH